MSNNTIEIVNDREKQDKVIHGMIEYLEGWVDDNPGLRMSIVDSINFNIAYVEVHWFKENKSQNHNVLIRQEIDPPMSFYHAFKILQSSFDNIIFNQ